ncbi:multicopper oxidase domain-containing protein [Nocardia xishanensis]|uniref:Multicopper oxidase domain-containing protein n=1 Tax=Nocardia xishanensis TaxID=238964 RepID=A0ABW7WVB0_9NOCA
MSRATARGRGCGCATSSAPDTPPRSGPFMLHCHNLEHEDMAMMADFVTE